MEVVVEAEITPGRPRFIVGIDLGTSNCALAFVEPAQGRQAAVVDFPVLQVNRPGEVLPLPLLPSCIYLPGEHELARELLLSHA